MSHPVQGRALRSVVAALLALLVLTACSGGDDGPYADQITIVPATDGQTSPAGTRLPVPLAVIVRSNEGRVLPRVRVRWRVSSGGGMLGDSITLSDASGRAQLDFVTGSAVGANGIQAELAVNVARYVSFTATTAAAPTLASVVPAQFTGGDVVTVQGTGLSAAALFEVNGAPARVASGTATSLGVVIPVCLAPGPVTLRARVNGGASNAIPGTYLASPAARALAVGEYASIDPAQLPGCATFPAAGPGGAEYLVAPLGATGSPGMWAEYRLVGDSVVTTAIAVREPAPPPSVASAFHESLRRREAESALRVAEAPVSGGMPQGAPAAVIPPKVGDLRGFRVCSKPDCDLLPDFTRVDARAVFVGTHVAVFQDPNAPANGFSETDITTLGQMFDNVLYDVATRAFGVESDIDGNGVVLVLLTPVVNGMTAKEQCASGFITGFFFSIDLDPTFLADPRANPGEVFYSLVPDPDGTVTCTLAKDRINRIVPGTFIHEFQHMINYHQHVLVRRTPAEQIWLNEGLSHLAEELGGLKYRDLGQLQTFSDLVIGDVYDGFLYLKSPGSYFTAFPGGGTLPERGAAWLFLRWLVDRFGTDLTRRLVETPLTGQDNIVSATGEPFPRLLSQWFLANYVSDLPGFLPQARLTYGSWAFRTTFAALNQQVPDRFDRVFPLQPLVASGGGIDASGTLRAGSGEYFRITQTAGQRGFTLRLTDPSGTAVASSVAPRLNVVRIR